MSNQSEQIFMLLNGEQISDSVKSRNREITRKFISKLVGAKRQKVVNFYNRRVERDDLWDLFNPSLITIERWKTEPALFEAPWSGQRLKFNVSIDIPMKTSFNYEFTNDELNDLLSLLEKPSIDSKCGV